MLSIHLQVRTTPAVGSEIACSAEPTGVLAKRFDVSTEIIRKWRTRGGLASKKWRASHDPGGFPCPTHALPKNFRMRLCGLP